MADKETGRSMEAAWYAMKEAHEVLTDTDRRRMYDETGFKSEEDMMAELERQRQREHPGSGPDGYHGPGPMGMWPQHQGPHGWGMPGWGGAPWGELGVSVLRT